MKIYTTTIDNMLFVIMDEQSKIGYHYQKVCFELHGDYLMIDTTTGRLGELIQEEYEELIVHAEQVTINSNNIGNYSTMPVGFYKDIAKLR